LRQRQQAHAGQAREDAEHRQPERDRHPTEQDREQDQEQRFQGVNAVDAQNLKKLEDRAGG
jgi:hypothetical protein